ncbi:MAG: hypothetical protein IKA88_04010 [Clostridia bacterium]|nr:hypothetical protein [Clostridia bacterium]
MKGNFLLYTALCFLGAIVFFFMGMNAIERKAHVPAIATRKLERQIEHKIAKDFERLFPYFAP